MKTIEDLLLRNGTSLPAPEMEKIKSDPVLVVIMEELGNHSQLDGMVISHLDSDSNDYSAVWEITDNVGYAVCEITYPTDRTNITVKYHKSGPWKTGKPNKKHRSTIFYLHEPDSIARLVNFIVDLCQAPRSPLKIYKVRVEIRADLRATKEVYVSAFDEEDAKELAIEDKDQWVDAEKFVLQGGLIGSGLLCLDKMTPSFIEEVLVLPPVGTLYTLVSRKKCTNPCSCETIVCTIPVASAAWCDRQA